MLNIDTMFVDLCAIFAVAGLAWLYILRSYHHFVPARYWCCAAFTASAGAAVALARSAAHWPILLGALLFMSSGWLTCMGIQNLQGRAVSWRMAVVAVASAIAGLAVFTLVDDRLPTRILILSLAQILPFMVALGEILPCRRRSGIAPKLMIGVIVLLMIAQGLRAGAVVFGWGGPVTLSAYNDVHGALMLVLTFLAMSWNFSLLLLAIERLRGEAADLAFHDDLTGIGNRRGLMQRLSEACMEAQQTGIPFVLLAIDLDDFKSVNDSHGHGAGDRCLQFFVHAAQSCLRPGDYLARSGGDEFSAVLPATTQSEGAAIAQAILERCRVDAMPWQDRSIRIAVSIGVAQWTQHVRLDPQRLIAEADRALYIAKDTGRDRCAAHSFEQTPTGAAGELSRVA